MNANLFGSQSSGGRDALWVCICVQHERRRKMRIQLCGWVCWIRGDSQDWRIPSFHVQGAHYPGTDMVLWGRVIGGGQLRSVRGSYDLMDVLLWGAETTPNIFHSLTLKLIPRRERCPNFRSQRMQNSCSCLFVLRIFALQQLHTSPSSRNARSPHRYGFPESWHWTKNHRSCNFC